MCPVRLYGQVAKEAQRCSLHNPTRTEMVNEASKARKEAMKPNLYKVTVDNTEDKRVYKKAPIGKVTRLVGEQRAQDLKKRGAQVELMVDTEANAHEELLRAYRQLSKDYEELAKEYEAVMSRH